MILEIDGWWASGKSVLKGLLDGHPEVFVSPLHDVVLMSFRNEDPKADWLKFKDTEHLRMLLATMGRYYRIERFANNGKVHYDFSSKDRVYMPFEMDFLDFDRKVFKQLYQMNTWTIESITEVIYQKFDQVLNNSELKRKYYASMGESFKKQLYNFPNAYPNGKYIYIDRSPESIIATRSGRKSIKEDFRGGYSDSAIEQIKGNIVEKILDYRNHVIKMSHKHPQSFLVVPFEELVINTKETMQKIRLFLGIEDHPSLTLFSHIGEEVTCNGKKYIGEENDKPEDLLTPEELTLIKKRKDSFHKSLNKSKKDSLSKKITMKGSKLLYELSKKM